MVSAVAISFAFLRSQSSIIFNVLATYVSRALLTRALDCSLLATARMVVEESTTTSDAGFRDEGWEPRKAESFVFRF
jgi:hypothetical protein